MRIVIKITLFVAILLLISYIILFLTLRQEGWGDEKWCPTRLSLVQYFILTFCNISQSLPPPRLDRTEIHITVVTSHSNSSLFISKHSGDGSYVETLL